ncbi:aminoglycoside phosphotransferase family protein [Paraburkholderia sediminicola]|uniref:aminoglycoside phosphotransferase family protein n=1 Tax=Paraburkholderia sediminicola TaxID=458836 RepID=UPI0038BD61D2
MSDMQGNCEPPIINDTLVRHLVSAQFPQWSDLPVRPVAISGWDNRTFHPGEQMLVRLPSVRQYAVQVEKELWWLPRLAPFLPLPIPVPLAISEPADGYPWRWWSIYRWLEGEAAASARVANLCDFAHTLAQFVTALQRLDPADGPPPGVHSFYRGGSLATYDTDTRQAITVLKEKIDVDAAIEVWEAALATTWQSPAVWIHGDISAGNLLVQEGRLTAVIDFGQLGVSDPACDLSIAWTSVHWRKPGSFSRDASV